MSIENIQISIPTTLSGTIVVDNEEILSKLPTNPTIKDIAPHLTSDQVNEYLFQLSEYLNVLSKDKDQLLKDWKNNNYDCNKDIEIEIEE